MLYVFLPLAGTMELGIIIVPPCSLDQFHDLLHHAMKETTGGPQVLGRMDGVHVMRDTTVAPQVQGITVRICVMRESMHLAG